MITTLTIIFICGFFAFSLSAICGGGASLMLIPILGNLLPVNQVPAALSIGTFSSSVSRIAVFYKNIRWHIVVYFVPAALPAVWLGAWLLKFVNPVYLELAMGLFLVSNLPFVFKKPKEINSSQKQKNWVLSLIGFLAGFLSGLTGAVGLIFNKFYLRYGLSKEEIVATRAANEIILHLLKIVLYTLFGLITIKVVSIGIVVALSAVASSVSMKWILPKLSETHFKKIGYLAMFFSGIMMLTNSTSSLLEQNNGQLSSKPIAKGLETKLQWQSSNFALEFTYDEGFEFELAIPIEQLTTEKQELVLAEWPEADKIIVEEVYSLEPRAFEAYYFKNNQLVHKIDFE